MKRHRPRGRLTPACLRLPIVTAFTLLAAAGTDPVGAQDTAALGGGALFRDDVAGTRTEPEFALDRINLGGFTLDSSVTGSVGYDSNVFNQQDARGDAFFLVTPQLNLNRDSGRNRLSLSASGLLRRQARLTAEDSEGYNGTLSDSLSLSDGAGVNATITAARTPEPRGTSGVGNGNAEPVVRHDFSGSAGGSVTLGAISLGGSVRASRQRFDDVELRQGGRASQAFRDTDALSAGVEAGVPLGTNLTGLIDVAYDVQRSPNADPLFDRDAHGISAQLGLQGYLSQLIAAQVRIGWRTRNFDNPRYSNFRGIYYSGTVDWYVLEFISLRATADRYFGNSGIGNAAGANVDRESLTAFYDPTPSLRVTATGAHTRERYREADLTDNRREASVSARYLFTRHLNASLRLARTELRSTDQRILDSYSATSVSLGTTYRF